MEGAQRASYRPRVGAKTIGVDRLTHDEPGDERALVTGGDRGRDAEPGRRLVGDPLGRAVDPEERGVLARQSQDVLAVAEPHAEVAVRDAALERHRLAVDRSKLPRQLAHDPGQIDHGCETYRLRLASYTFTP